MFRNYDRPHSTSDHSGIFNKGDASAARVWKVARATSAAPLYFSKMVIGDNTYLDGGMGCNNPAELMFHEIHGTHGREPELILSIGTGTKPKVQNGAHSKREKNGKHRFLDNARNVIHAAKRLPDIATDSEIIHDRLRGSMSLLRTKKKSKYPMYFRFNVPDLGSMKLDSWESTENSEEPDGKKTLEALELSTLAYLDTPAVSEDLESCAKELVRMRRERARTERWEEFATHTTYRCPERKEHECEDLVFSSRGKLRLHASECHDFVPWVSIEDQPGSDAAECAEDNPLCIIDECAEHPQLFTGEDATKQLLDHLRGPTHKIKDAKPMSTPALEAWLDLGRTTTDAAFQEEPPAPSHEQNDPIQQPAVSHNVRPDRARWTNLLQLRGRSPASRSDQHSTGR